MKKRLLSLFLALVMVLGTLPATVSAEEEASHESVCQDILTCTDPEMQTIEDPLPDGATLIMPVMASTEEEASHESACQDMLTITNPEMEEESLPDGPTLILPSEGENGLVPFAVGDHEMSESEPNNRASTADRVYSDYTVSGYLSGTDLDYFKFSVSSKSKVTLIAVASYRSFMMGIYNSSEDIIGADTTGVYEGGSYSYGLTGTLNSGTYYICLLDGDQRARNTYVFYLLIEPLEASHTHSYASWITTAEPTCTENGSQQRTCSTCGHVETKAIDPLGHDPEIRNVRETTETEPGYTGDTVCRRCETVLEYGKEIPAGTNPVYRMYNPYTTETLYVNEDEHISLTAAGWIDQGFVWNAPKSGTDLVYRVYNTYDDYHIYIKDEDEIANLAEGWQVDGIAFFCAGAENGIPIRRMCNPTPAPRTCYHYYTVQQAEIDQKLNEGWDLEGIAWYAVK